VEAQEIREINTIIFRSIWHSHQGNGPPWHSQLDVLLHERVCTTTFSAIFLATIENLAQSHAIHIAAICIVELLCIAPITGHLRKF
jgi:hypothetical protein